MSAVSQKSLVGWLVVLIAGVGASIWQLQAPSGLHPGLHGGHQHAAQSGPQPMFSWKPHEAHRIELRTANQSIDMALTEAGWRGEPPGFDAAAFVTMFSRARADRSFEPVPGSDYGLEPGVMTLLVKDAKGSVLAGLIIGERLPDGIGRYVRGTTTTLITVIPEYQLSPVLQAAGMSLTDAQKAGVQAMDVRVAQAHSTGSAQA
nr:hypothetical protein [Pseudomonas sp.]